ncbi:MAG: MdtA/MuxA family multidrug efflux RND transporter periplasmic adaptor subunit [Candidatus Acidiferrales bacterium]
MTEKPTPTNIPNSTSTAVSPRPVHTEGDQTAPPEKSNWWVWAIVVVVGILIVAFMYRQYEAAKAEHEKANQVPVRAIPITTATAKQGDIGVYITALGTVTPVYTVTVTSRVQGQIMAIHYTEGQMVKAGDALVDIDPRPYQVQLAQAEGQLQHDQAVLDEAKIDLTRYQTAFKKNAIAEQQVADQEQTVLQDEGTVKNDQAGIDSAKLSLVYCHITSPITGRVGLRMIDLGNIVQAGSTSGLVVVTQLQPITLVFNVAEDYLPQIQAQVHQGHKLEVDAFDRDQQKKIASGSLLTTDNEIDTTTGTVKLKAIFPNQDESLFPNQFVNARLLVDTEHGVTLVANAAIQRSAQGSFVYIIKPDETAAMQTVTPGVTDGGFTAVQGLQPNNVVASSGFDKLQDGAKVVVRNPAGTGTNAASGPGAATGSTQTSSSSDSGNSHNAKRPSKHSGSANAQGTQGNP